MVHSNIQGIIIVYILFMVIWVMYMPYRFYYGDIFGKIKIADVLKDKKCYIQSYRCDEEIIDGWSLLHFFMYAIIGYLYPGEYIFIFITSILVEMTEHLIQLRPKYILDPLVNITAYSMGHLLNSLLH